MKARADEPFAGASREAEAPELKALPPARRPLKLVAIAVMAVTAAFALFLAYSLLGEARFALSRAQATNVGSFATAELAPHEGGFVRASVSLEGKPTASFDRPLDRLRYRITRAESGPGEQQRWVIYPVARAVEGPRFTPPTLVAGRLERLGDLGVRFSGLEGGLAELGEAPSDEAWVIIDGEEPTNMAWVIAFEVLLLAFAAFNLGSIARVVRRVG